MAWTQADIDTLKAAILERKGARSIAFSDQVVTFGSVDEMKELLAMMQDDVGATSGRPRTRYGAFSKGV
jgi:hypothetical protein